MADDADNPLVERLALCRRECRGLRAQVEKLRADVGEAEKALAEAYVSLGERDAELAALRAKAGRQEAQLEHLWEGYFEHG